MSVGTITLMYTLTSSLAFLAGLWSATYLQDRETRRRHVGIARALLAEIGRISSEVGAHNPAYLTMTINGAKPKVPLPAPWVQSLATDLASTDASVLSRFMELERYLTNLASSDRDQDALRARVNVLQEAVEAHKRNGDALGQMSAEGELAQMQQRLSTAQFAVQTNFGNVVSALNDIRTSLKENEHALSTRLSTHLRRLGWNRSHST